MKRSTIVLSVLVLAAALSAPPAAQNVSFPAPAAADPLTSTVEGYRAPLINPAALAFGNARGITYGRSFDSEGIRDGWELFLNTRNLAYGLQHTPADLYHSLSLSFSPADNLYSGLTLTTPNWNLPEAQYTAGLLYRPMDSLSLGLRGIFREDTDTRSAYSAALRPFAFSALPDRLLTAGFELGLTELDSTAYTLSLNSTPFDWLDLRAGYELKEETFTASLSLSFHYLKSGAGGVIGSDPSVSSGRAYLTAAPHPYTRPLESPGTMLLQRYRLDGPIVNARPATAMGGFYLLSEATTIWKVREELQRLAEDPQVDGIAFINDHPRIPLSMAAELIAALREFKESGKKIVFYQDYMSSVDYLLAAAVGDEVYLHPSGMIDFKGLAVSRPYLERFLARFGVEVDNYRSHPYKSSYNFLTEPGMTDAEREALSMLLSSMQEDMLRLIREGRGNELEKPLEEIVDAGPYMVAERALEAGMVDGLLQKDRFSEQLFSDGGRSVEIRQKMPAEPFRRDWSDPLTEKVALINAVGTIHTGEGAPGSSIGAETLTEAIRAARKDSTVSGILLRVDSGGGSALASAMIAREIELAVTGEEPKPVVVSMGSTAASGGYYIAAKAKRIVAQPTTLTGSIGVIGVVPHIEELLAKQEIAWEVVKEGDHADMGAIYRELTAAEREKLSGSIMHTYERFITAVSEGRDMEKEQVDEVARGRVWSGRQAKERGLVDELGGIDTALEVLKEEIGTDRPIALEDFTYRGIMPIPLGGFTSSALAALTRDPWPAQMAAVPPSVRSAYLRLLHGDDGIYDYVLTVMPYTFPELTE